MVRKYFGTDGIRGKANEGAMTAETALRVGMAAGFRVTPWSRWFRLCASGDQGSA
uniref:hypothetical protein n=1 Tax=Yersinia ruckeri TaxID=29486 RepID=UPI001E54DCDB